MQRGSPDRAYHCPRAVPRAHELTSRPSSLAPPCVARLPCRDLLTRHRIKFHGLIETPSAAGSPKKRRKTSLSSAVKENGSICRACALDDSLSNSPTRCDGLRPACGQSLEHVRPIDPIVSETVADDRLFWLCGSLFVPARCLDDRVACSYPGSGSALSSTSSQSPHAHGSSSLGGRSDRESSGPNPFLDAYYRTHLPVSNTLGVPADVAFPPPFDGSSGSGSASGSGSSSRSFQPATPAFPPQSLSGSAPVVESPAAYVPHLNGYGGMFDAWGAVGAGTDLGPDLVQYGSGMAMDDEQPDLKSGRSQAQPSLPELKLPSPSSSSTGAEAEAKRHQTAALDNLFLSFPHPDSLYGIQPSPYLATPHRGRSPVAQSQSSPPSNPSRLGTSSEGGSDAFREALARSAREKGDGFELRLDFGGGKMLRRTSAGLVTDADT